MNDHKHTLLLLILDNSVTSVSKKQSCSCVKNECWTGIREVHNDVSVYSSV